MSRQDWFKVVMLVLLPINVWLGVFYYLHWKKQKDLWDVLQRQGEEMTLVHYFQEKHRFKVGEKLVFPKYPSKFIGNPPPLGQGYPVLYIRIVNPLMKEVWEPIIKEALNASPYLYVTLIDHSLMYLPHRREVEFDKSILELVREIKNPRLSVWVGSSWVFNLFGAGYKGGTLLILCDGKGIIRAIEPFPKLKISPYLHEEIKDWKPKLYQTVKKVLNKFFSEHSQ